MPIRDEYANKAKGNDSENPLIIEALRKFKQAGVHQKLVESQVALLDVTDEARTSLIIHLSSYGYLDRREARQGMFSIPAYVLTSKGEKLLEQIDGIDSAEVEQTINKHILEEAKKSQQAYVPYHANYSDDRVERLARKLASDRLLINTNARQGFFTIQAYLISAKGERFLEESEGIDSAEVDRKLQKHILEAAKNSSLGFIPSHKDYCDDRLSDVARLLTQKGFVDRASVRQGMFTVEGVTITPEGLQELKRIEEDIYTIVTPVSANASSSDLKNVIDVDAKVISVAREPS